MGKSTEMCVGETVYAVGNPEGLEGTFSNGLLSGIRQTDGRRELQVTAPISHGSSGGALLNSSGKVIGVTCGYLANGQNLNFAVPIELVKDLLKLSAPIQVPQSSTNKQAAIAYINHGNALSELGDYQRAISDYIEALRFDPQNAWAHRFLAYAYLRNSNTLVEERNLARKAEVEYTEALLLDPNDILTYAGRAAARLIGQNYLGAIADCDIFLAGGICIGNRPFQAMVLSATTFNRGAAKLLLHRGKPVTSDLFEALHLNAQDSFLKDNGEQTKALLDSICYVDLGNAFLELGDCSTASQFFIKASQLEPDKKEGDGVHGLIAAKHINLVNLSERKVTSPQVRTPNTDEVLATGRYLRKSCLDMIHVLEEKQASKGGMFAALAARYLHLLNYDTWLAGAHR